VERVGCVDIRALPLQLLLADYPDWMDQPVAVVDADKPQGLILWANRAARAGGIVVGMRYAAGLALCRELHGGVVSEGKVDAAVAMIARELWRFSPRIEPSDKEPGVFWLDASGMGPLYPSLADWAVAIREHLAELGFRTVVAVGFTLFGTYAAARSQRQDILFSTAVEEQRYVHQVPLTCLGFGPELLATLAKLGIRTVGGFIALPAAGVRKRFGIEAETWHRLARNGDGRSIQPCPLREPVACEESLEYPEENVERLVFRIARLLTGLLGRLAEYHEALKTIEVVLRLNNGREWREIITPAMPTQEATALLSLVHLRLDTISLQSGVVELKLQALGVKVVEEQYDLFQEAPRRRKEAADRAFAKLRAELGNDAVVCARLAEGHLPEARYRWELVDSLAAPQAVEPTRRPLIRRIYRPPLALPYRGADTPDRWVLHGVADGPVEEVVGPHVVSGGWWMREVSRKYYYVRTRSNRWLWIYHDGLRRRWFLQGEVQ